MTDCKFCSDYNWHKDQNTAIETQYETSPLFDYRIRHTIEVTMVIDTWKLRNRKAKKDHLCQVKTRMYPINYCPVCGKELKK